MFVIIDIASIEAHLKAHNDLDHIFRMLRQHGLEPVIIPNDWLHARDSEFDRLQDFIDSNIHTVFINLAVLMDGMGGDFVPAFRPLLKRVFNFDDPLSGGIILDHWTGLSRITFQNSDSHQTLGDFLFPIFPSSILALVSNDPHFPGPEFADISEFADIPAFPIDKIDCLLALAAEIAEHDAYGDGLNDGDDPDGDDDPDGGDDLDGGDNPKGDDDPDGSDNYPEKSGDRFAPNQADNIPSMLKAQPNKKHPDLEPNMGEGAFSLVLLMTILYSALQTLKNLSDSAQSSVEISALNEILAEAENVVALNVENSPESEPVDLSQSDIIPLEPPADSSDDLDHLLFVDLFQLFVPRSRKISDVTPPKDVTPTKFNNESLQRNSADGNTVETTVIKIEDAELITFPEVVMDGELLLPDDVTNLELGTKPDDGPEPDDVTESNDNPRLVQVSLPTNNNTLDSADISHAGGSLDEDGPTPEPINDIEFLGNLEFTTISPNVEIDNPVIDRVSGNTIDEEFQFYGMSMNTRATVQPSVLSMSEFTSIEFKAESLQRANDNTIEKIALEIIDAELITLPEVVADGDVITPDHVINPDSTSDLDDGFESNEGSTPDNGDPNRSSDPDNGDPNGGADPDNGFDSDEIDPNGGSAPDDGSSESNGGSDSEGGTDLSSSNESDEGSGPDDRSQLNDRAGLVHELSPVNNHTFTNTHALNTRSTLDNAFIFERTDVIDFMCNPQPTTIVLDFETNGSGQSLMAGDIIDDEFQSYGVSITTHDPGQNPAMIFDTRQPTGNDVDLAVAPGIVDHVLIISEDANPANPDDNVEGGTIQFTFDSLVGNVTVGVLDIDFGHSDGYVEALDQDGQILGRVGIPATGDHQLGEVHLDITGIAAINVSLESSGAITELRYDTLSPNPLSVFDQGQDKLLDI